ncbi:hypothetical protein [Bradyrhizobium sp.]|uniref:hypothetical protein n=1 Tax=Bradyrhizobium sp. TaxID=376 RepID=UPI0025BFD63E|nr:hypothetical protein [Bradyrhizobium sp.]
MMSILAGGKRIAAMIERASIRPGTRPKQRQIRFRAIFPRDGTGLPLLLFSRYIDRESV